MVGIAMAFNHNKPPVSVISVTYNSENVLPSMLASLPANVDIIIVDNDSSDQSISIAKSYGAQTIENDINLGFGIACNLGAKLTDNDYLLFLNPDTQIRPDTIQILLDAAKNHPQGIAFNPLMSKTFELYPEDQGSKELNEVTFSSGAALFISRKDFKTVGGFDENIHLYFEDYDLSKRLLLTGRKLYQVPAAKIVHLHSKSSPISAEMAKYKAYQWARSQVYVKRKYTEKYAFIKCLIPAIWKILNPKLLISPIKRSKYSGRLAGVWSMRHR